MTLGMCSIFSVCWFMFFLTVFSSAFYIARKCCKLDKSIIKINWRCVPCGVSIYVVVGSSVCILGGSICQRGTCHQLSLTWNSKHFYHLPTVLDIPRFILLVLFSILVSRYTSFVMDLASLLKRGRLLAIEGPELAGKSTQSQLLCTALRDRRYKAMVYIYPG